MTKRRVAMLLELEEGDDDLPKLRRFLKCLLRSYGLRCVSIRPPKETNTFGSATEPDSTDQNTIDERKKT